MPQTRPRPPEVARKLLHRLIARGPLEVLSLAVGRIREAFSSDDVLILLLRDASGDVPARTGLKFRPAEPDDAAIYARDVGTDSESTFTARLGDATSCYVVESAGMIVHATWATTEPAWMREVQRYFVPPHGDAYIFESYTRPDARGRGIYPFAITSLASFLGTRGIARMWVGIEGHNEASLRSVTKAGFHEAFRLSFSRRLARLTLSPPQGPMAEVGRRCIVDRATLGDG